MRTPTKKEWIKFSIVLTLYLLFLLWLKSWLGLVLVPFIVDNYITKWIPWGWWKKSKSQLVRNIMSWVDAIVFALVAVYFVNLFFFQNYVIPSSSLEKSLLIGDYLFVSKMSYGARKPQTPLSLPLTQHTLPITNTKSYCDGVRWPYERVSGLGKIELNDIVVFNYPAGDTVVANPEIIDYYAECYRLGQRRFPNTPNMDSLSTKQQRAVYDLYHAAGKEYIEKNKGQYGEIISRPVDRRENYVKRAVGLPGQTIEIKDKAVYLDGELNKNPENVQFNYWVKLKYQMPERIRRKLEINKEDLQRGSMSGSYLLPLTQKSYEELKKNSDLVEWIEPMSFDISESIYPLNGYTKWTPDNYGPVWIPKKGESIELTLENLPIYERPIAVYEGNDLKVVDGKIFINGMQSSNYTFTMDYYWMMGDNRHNSADSRYWGFVPEDHIVGKPIMVWLSLDKDRGWFDGKIRWNRLFKWVDSYK